MRKNRAMNHTIAVLALDRVVAFDLGVPSQVFGAARDRTGERALPHPGLRHGGTVRSTAGFTVTPEHDLSVLTTADTVIVPGVGAGSAVTIGTLDPVVTDALRAAHARGARIVSICTGASVLAAAGLLDDRPAATHWAWADRLTGLYPAGRAGTSTSCSATTATCSPRPGWAPASTSACTSCAVTTAARWRTGRPGAAWCRHGGTGGQAQYIERPVPTAAGAGTEQTRAWALDRLAEPVSLEDMAAHARMSVRTFTRRFRDETGLSPARWLLQQRVAHARLLLESTDLAVDAVARRSGLGSATALRQHMQATIGVAPSAYRRTFRLSTTHPYE